MTSLPIGIIDSGSGGLSIYQDLNAMLPFESFVYLGDHRFVPYSSKQTGVIRQRIIRLISYLTKRYHTKIIVIACNTATVAGIDMYRAKFPKLPIVGVVPVVKTAAEVSKTKSFIVLSTEFTAKSRYQKALISAFASDCSVLSLGNRELVACIEDTSCHKNIPGIVNNFLQPFNKEKHDVVVLGCTHFPFVRDTIRAIVGEKVPVLDSGKAVSRQVKRVLHKRKEESDDSDSKSVFLTTGNENNVSEIYSVLLKQPVKARHVNV